MNKDEWIPIREGVFRKSLAEDSGRGIQMDLIRLDPNFVDQGHLHDDFEWVYVLEGGFTDDAGVHKAGDFVLNTTEGVHKPSTGDDGCLLLIVWTGSVSPIE